MPDAHGGVGVLVSMPSRRGMTFSDATIDNRSTKLVRAFAPRPAWPEVASRQGLHPDFICKRKQTQRATRQADAVDDE